jgi:hypothetical protein
VRGDALGSRSARGDLRRERRTANQIGPLAMLIACVAAGLLAVVANAAPNASQSGATQTVVKGQGSSLAAGFVKVNARGDVTSAKGKFRVRLEPFGGRLAKGRVTCVDPFTPFPGRASVGGVLKRPIVGQGQTFTHFVFQVQDGGPGQPDFAVTFLITADFAPFLLQECGFLFWFDVAWDLRFPESLRVTEGDFVVSSRPAHHDDDDDDD